MTGTWHQITSLRTNLWTHVDALAPEEGEPVLGHAVKAARLGDGVHEADDMCAGELIEQVRAGFRICCESARDMEMSLEAQSGRDRGRGRGNGQLA